MSNLTALVAGGGIGGLATAAALAQRGWAVTVYERQDQLRAVGAGIYIWENGLRVLEALDAFDDATADDGEGWRRIRHWLVCTRGLCPARGGRIGGRAYIDTGALPSGVLPFAGRATKDLRMGISRRATNGYLAGEALPHEMGIGRIARLGRRTSYTDGRAGGR